MCGIIGYVGSEVAVPILIEALKCMEYRGYDSAGVAIMEDGALQTIRHAGRVRELETKLDGMKFAGGIGLGHTRWATHGRPSEVNAHPQRSASGEIVVVHNGIIENYLPLRRELEAQGVAFSSQTDTEVIANLIAANYSGDLLAAIQAAACRLEGSYAIGVMSEREPDQLIAVRKGSPLVISGNDLGVFLASDLTALLPHSRDMFFLDDGEIAILRPGDIQFRTLSGQVVTKAPQHIAWDVMQAQKLGYKHFMIKEINEQPIAIRDTLMGRLDDAAGGVSLEELGTLTDDILRDLEQIVIVACGTAWHAGLVGKYLLESLAGIRVEVDYASEFRYRTNQLTDRTLVLAVSQSGETADTLAALQRAGREGAHTLAICNAVGSTMTRSVEGVLYTHAGPEISVASTKAFTTQLTALMLLALKLGRLRGAITESDSLRLVTALRGLPELMTKSLECEAAVQALAGKYWGVQHFLYLGRSLCYPVALEGALKLKEISYIHAEGYPAGEMKHGPIALIDERMPVVVLAPRNHVMDKTLSNLNEVKARGGKIIVICQDASELDGYGVDEIIEVPASEPELAPLVLTIPLQLLAYHIAVILGCDVDQPRNLAKSVTVE
ncbi:MAG: Glutamine--fructose-6-phosphate aminotransferase [isomerizing] [bacterium]|nr:Glutamine--fructose-6-phosphate aminotransferase [isomerizing] [bacterium]